MPRRGAGDQPATPVEREPPSRPRTGQERSSMRWKSMRSIVAGGVLCALLIGCAGNTVKTLPYIAQPTAAKAEDAKVDGIRYYEEAPFILVYSDSKGGLH